MKPHEYAKTAAHKLGEFMDEKIKVSNDKRLNTADIYTQKVLSVTKNDDEKDKIVSAYQKFKIFLKQYGKIGLTVYWLTWGSFTIGSYHLFKYNLIDYHSWSWLHLESMEQQIQNLMKKWLDKEIVIDKHYEDIVASILMGKITKPVQWVIVYFATPPISNYLNPINKNNSKCPKCINDCESCDKHMH